MERKNIPLLVMSLLFVGALTYGGFHIALAQQGEFLDEHPFVAKLFGVIQKGDGRDNSPGTEKSVALEDNTENDDGFKNEAVEVEQEDHDGRREALQSDKSRDDDGSDAEEEEGEDDDDSWVSPSGGTPLATLPQAPALVAPQVTPSATLITLSQVAQHKTANDCWMVIEGKVYSVSTYVGRHPGGSAILSGCGIDATTMFNEKGGRGHSQSAWNLLPQFFVGALGA